MIDLTPILMPRIWLDTYGEDPTSACTEGVFRLFDVHGTEITQRLPAAAVSIRRRADRSHAEVILQLGVSGQDVHLRFPRGEVLLYEARVNDIDLNKQLELNSITLEADSSGLILTVAFDAIILPQSPL